MTAILVIVDAVRKLDEEEEEAREIETEVGEMPAREDERNGSKMRDCICGVGGVAGVVTTAGVGVVVIRLGENIEA